MADTEIIEWHCRGGHVLGTVARAGHQHRLSLYRSAVMPGEPGEVMATVVGSVDSIVCSMCGRVRDWHAGEAAIERLLRRLAGGEHQAWHPPDIAPTDTEQRD